MNPATQSFQVPWVNRRYKVLSLCDMKTYLASRLIGISKNLIECHLANTALKYDTIPQPETLPLAIQLTNIADEAKAISLPMTAKAALRIRNNLQNYTVKWDDFTNDVSQLDILFDDELENKKLFLIDPDSFKYYDNTELAGEQFKSNFTRANFELIEAGNCLVLDRYTACVFHLMRGLDIALNSLQTQLGIPLPDKLAARTWGKTLERIKTKMDQNDTAPTTQWNQDKEFYEKAYAFIQAAKTAFRDSTMHVESTYDQSSAQSVFNVAVEVLRHLATKLKE